MLCAEVASGALDRIDGAFVAVVTGRACEFLIFVVHRKFVNVIARRAQVLGVGFCPIFAV